MIDHHCEDPRFIIVWEDEDSVQLECWDCGYTSWEPR